MGLFDVFKFAADVAASTPSTGRSSIRSPWTTGSLTSWAIQDIIGDTEALAVSRADAMRVPAIVKGRALITGTLSRMPLVTLRGSERMGNPPWLYRTDTRVAPSQRMLWTVDDLIFAGVSLWAVERGTRRQIMDAVRVPPEWWQITPDLQVLVNGASVNSDEIILFEGPQDGLLEIAAQDIRASRSMSRAWSARVTSPVPLVELHNTDPTMELEDGEISDLIDSWESARQSGGATGYTPATIDARIHGEVAPDLFIEGRNASRLDFANYMHIPAALLEGSPSEASLTYSTTEGKRNEFADYTITYWAGPIEARLSMDDVTARGQRIAFDMSEWLTPAHTPTGPTRED